MENIVHYCQSCYMPMDETEKFGTEADGSKSEDYCVHCYQNGEFPDGFQSFEQAVEENIRWWKNSEDESDDIARERIMEVFPNLKRWKV